MIGRKLPRDAVLLADAGAHLAWLGYYVELEEGQHFRKAGEFGPMAGHTNGALGVQVAHPDRTVVVGCGDGCYNLSGFELMTAVEHDLPVIWVIFDDREFKLIKIYQVAAYQETGLVEFQNPNYAALRPGLRGGRLHRRDARGVRGGLRRGPGVGTSVGHRRPDHALGDPPLQPVTGRHHRRSREDGRGKVPVLMTKRSDPQGSETTQPDDPAEHASDAAWFEEYLGGSPEAERAEFERLATLIMEAQATAQKKASRHGVPHAAQRTLHAKSTLAVDHAELRFRDDLAEDLRHEFAQPGAAYRTVVRFSNAANVAEL